MQLDSRRNLGNLERLGVKVQDLLSDVMIYSYCNDEPFYPPKRIIVSDGNGGASSRQFDTYLSHAQEPSTGAEDSRQEKVSERVKREEEAAKCMHICLATGVKKGVCMGGGCSACLIVDAACCLVTLNMLSS